MPINKLKFSQFIYPLDKSPAIALPGDILEK
jgi:hypothetical protein